MQGTAKKIMTETSADALAGVEKQAAKATNRYGALWKWMLNKVLLFTYHQPNKMIV